MNPADEARVRDLLAAARHDAGLPEDVAARLDKTLTDLNAQRATNPAIVPRDELAAKRRRRAVALLAAAAVIVIGGVSVGQVLSPRGGDEVAVTEDAGGGAAAPESAESGDAFSSGEAADSARSESPNTLQGPTGATPEVAPTPLGRPVRLRSDTFAADVRRVAAQRLDAPRSAVETARDLGCAEGDYGRGVLIPARYDGVPTVLAFRPPVGDTRVAEVLTCGTGEVLRSVTLPED